MDPWYFANGLMSLLCALTLSWIVLNPRIDEGMIVKVGLNMMILSLLVTTAQTFSDSFDWEAYWRAGTLLRVGIAVVCLGVFVRVSGCCDGMPRRRMSDWLHPQ